VLLEMWEQTEDLAQTQFLCYLKELKGGQPLLKSLSDVIIGAKLL
jgi:hypothetical protein